MQLIGYCDCNSVHQLPYYLECLEQGCDDEAAAWVAIAVSVLEDELDGFWPTLTVSMRSQSNQLEVGADEGSEALHVPLELISLAVGHGCSVAFARLVLIAI